MLVTHSDNDHYSVPTCRDLAGVTGEFHSTQYVASLMKQEGLPAYGHDIGEHFTIGPVRAEVTPADHAWQNESPGASDRIFQPEDRCGFWLETPDGNVEAPTSEEEVTPGDRIRLRLAERATDQGMSADTAKEIYEVRPDADVSTGAMAAVEQEADDWRARWVLVEQDGSLVVRSLHLEPDVRNTPPGGVTTNLLRELSPSAAIAAGAARLANPDRTKFSDLLLTWKANEAREHGPVHAGTTSGRPRLSDEHLAAVALAYLDELRAGPGVLGRLGKHFNREPETMRDQVRIARKRGFLTPAIKTGRKGAAPGPRLIEFMSETNGGENND